MIFNQDMSIRFFFFQSLLSGSKVSCKYLYTIFSLYKLLNLTMAIHALVSDTLEEVTDPSDWSECKYPELADLDSYLRCQICKDLLKAPVLTTCGHTFCSICIRRSITESNKCPACLEETYESGLRKVLLLDNIVKWFSQHRKELLNKLQPEHINDSQEQENSDINESSYIVTNNSKGNENQSTTNFLIPRDVSNVLISNEINSDPPNEKSEKEILAECPICGVFKPVSEIQGSHIDKCLTSGHRDKSPNLSLNQPQPSSPKGTRSKTLHNFFDKSDKSKNGGSLQLQPHFLKSKQRLANLDTSISTSKLKEKLNSLHLSSSGTRNQMEQRMKEYINLYNANLDSINPVSDRVVVDRLQKWEALINNKPNNGGLYNSNNTSNARNTSSPPVNYDEPTIKRQKIQHDEWNNKNNDQYLELIKKARANMKKQNKDKPSTNNDGKSKAESFSDDDSELLL